MKNSQTELKSVAKAIGASLKRNGHAVPHTAVLHAVAAALNKRDWNTLKASLSADASLEPRNLLEDVKALDASTLMLARLACFLEIPVRIPHTKAQAEQLENIVKGATVSCVMKWAGWNLPVSLFLKEGNLLIEADNFVPENPKVPAILCLPMSKRGHIQVEAGYFTDSRTWNVTAQGVKQLKEQLERRVSLSDLAELGAWEEEPILKGNPVSAKFWTDDRAFEAEFDARPYLQQASAESLYKILAGGCTGDYCTDAIAEYMQEHKLNQDIEEGLQYLSLLPSKRDIGFEVRVDEEELVRWMAEHQKPALAKYLCEQNDVRVVQSSDEGSTGRWDWIQGTEGSEVSFDTEEAAMLNAMDQLDLLAEHLEQM